MNQEKSKEATKHMIEWIGRNSAAWYSLTDVIANQDSFELDTIHQISKGVLQKDDPCYELVPIMLAICLNFQGRYADEAAIFAILQAAVKLWDQIDPGEVLSNTLLRMRELQKRG